MTIIISNCTSQECNIITETILRKAQKINANPKILSHDIDQQVIIEVSAGVAENTFKTNGIKVEIIDQDSK